MFRYLLPLSLLILGGAVSVPTARAASVTFDFVTESPLGTTFGAGYFTFDDSLLAAPAPITITHADLNDFSYSDSVLGTLAHSGSSPASLNFTLGWNPATSLFAFTAASADNLRSITAMVDGLNSPSLGSVVNFNTNGFAWVYLRFPTQRPLDPGTDLGNSLPEPTTLVPLSMGAASTYLARRRRVL